MEALGDGMKVLAERENQVILETDRERGMGVICNRTSKKVSLEMLVQVFYKQGYWESPTAETIKEFEDFKLQ